MPRALATIPPAGFGAALSGKARQIYLVLRDDIVSGRMAVGDRLPPETEIADRHGVSRATARRALCELEGERLIERRPSAGTRVISNGGMASVVGDIANLVSHIHEMGRTTSVRLLSFGYGRAAAAVVAALRLPSGTEVQQAVRVRDVDGAPFSFLTTSVPAEIGRTYGEQDLRSAPLIHLLERSGIVIARAEQAIAATLAGPDVALQLGVAVGAPLLELRRTVFDADGRGVEYLHALYRPDRYTFRMDLVRTGLVGARTWSAALAGGARPNRTTGPNRRRKTKHVQTSTKGRRR